MAIKNLEQLLSDLKPRLKSGVFVFCSVQNIPAGLSPLSIFKEEEGLSIICHQSDADTYKLHYDGLMKMITLDVYSSLDAVGMTAVISKALTDVSISANVVAAYHHDHVFVPLEKAEKAVKVLTQISQN